MSSDIRPEDVHSHCRCCLNKLGGDNSINSSEMPRPLFQLFRYCTGFRIWQKGLYPEYMCKPCHELLISFDRFEKLCKQSSCVLEELLNGHKVSPETSSDSLQSFQSGDISQGSKPSQVLVNDKKVTPILSSNLEFQESIKENISFERIDVKPEVGKEPNATDEHHMESDFEEFLPLSDVDDAEVKSETSSTGASGEFTEDISIEINVQNEMGCKKQIKPTLHCEKCGDVFKTTLKLKQHTEKFHKIEFLPNSNQTRNVRRHRKKTGDREVEGAENISLHEESLEIPVDLKEAMQPNTSVQLSEDVAFQNMVSTPKLENSTLEGGQQYSDSDFEDSLALTELRKSTLKVKEKKSANKKRKKSNSPLNSETETFGPIKVEKPKVVCDKCPRKFKWPFELRRHIKEMHGDKPLELACKYDCGKIFNSQNTLKSHYRIKHQMKKQIYRENAYICEQCGKGFKRLPLLERHRFHHLPLEARPYKCEQCGKTFVMERIYKEHLLRHSGNKKYECSYCGIKKATLGEYREHINIHTKEREYACELCPKIFYRSKNLVQHVSAVHQGIKKHFCRYCQHSFANHINLVHHERIHTGEKPYSCEICKRSFIQPSALKTHMKTHDETRVKAKVGRKPKISKPKVDFDLEAIMDDNLHQQINNYTN